MTLSLTFPPIAEDIGVEMYRLSALGVVDSRLTSVRANTTSDEWQNEVDQDVCMPAGLYSVLFLVRTTMTNSELYSNVSDLTISAFLTDSKPCTFKQYDSEGNCIFFDLCKLLGKL